MDPHFIGQTAAIFTAFLWTLNSLLFAAAGRRIGALSVNAFRIVMAVVLLALAHLILLGTFVPDANRAQWFYLGLSGIIGLGTVSTALAYILYFRILTSSGATNLLLVTLLIPVSAGLLGVWFLGETLTADALWGMGLIALGLGAVDGRILKRRIA